MYIDDLSPGVYNATVIDNLGCSKIESFIVNDPFDYTLADASCLTVADGSIEIYDIFGGYPPYSVFLNDELVADEDLNRFIL